MVSVGSLILLSWLSSKCACGFSNRARNALKWNGWRNTVAKPGKRQQNLRVRWSSEAHWRIWSISDGPFHLHLFGLDSQRRSTYDHSFLRNVASIYLWNHFWKCILFRGEMLFGLRGIRVQRTLYQCCVRGKKPVGEGGDTLYIFGWWSDAGTLNSPIPDHVHPRLAIFHSLRLHAID